MVRGKAGAAARAAARNKLVVTEEEDKSSTTGTDIDTDSESKSTAPTESDTTASSEETDDTEDSDDDSDEETDEDETDDDEEEETDDDDEDEEDSGEEESDASSTGTTTAEQRLPPEELSSASIRASRSMSEDVAEVPIDLEAAKAVVSAAHKPDPISPSVGAASMLEPSKIIENPFAEPGKNAAKVSESAASKPPPLPPLSTYTAKQRAASEKADRINDSEYDLILASMVSQNRKLNQDPKAMRRSAMGMGKLRQSFERLQMRNQAKSEAEADGVGGSSKDFGLVLDDKEEKTGSGMDESEAENIDWEFWGGLIKNYNSILSTSPIELSKAIYSGIPSALRGMMWQLLSSSKDEELEAQYARYLSLPCPHEAAIRRDLNRTFPSQEYFKDVRGVGQENLYNVVKAYSLYDPECGYCQGMQFIVGPLLLNMPDEEAFSTLVRLMQNYDLRGHYIPNMPSLQLRLYQFDRIVEETLPALYMHLLRRGIKSSMYASQWFMTLFSYRFPLEVVYRILDSIFAEGIEAMFRFALALMSKNEAKLLELDFEGCLEFLKDHLIDVYTNEKTEGKPESVRIGELVRDAFKIKIPQYTLDAYANEFYDQAKQANERQVEMEALRLVNRNLQMRVQSLEEQLSHLNAEHVDLVKRVVMEKLSHDEMAEELVRYKMMYAEAVLQNESPRTPTLPPQ